METICIPVPLAAITIFRKKILSWYKLHKRVLPWRDTGNPYHVLISEYMLQQTQVARVMPFFLRWIEKYPDLTSLAKSKQGDVLALWNGLGYNSRAIRLRESAIKIVNGHNAIIPSDYNTLKKLPGIGDYMASSIPAFAYNKTLPVIDINIRRVLIAEFQLPPDIPNESLKPLALSCIPKNKSAMWHNALMDYGAAMAMTVKKSIPPLTKQSRFTGSFRQVRGKIIKLLIEKGKMSLNGLQASINDARLEKALEALLDEKLVFRKGTTYRL
ncbi:MAG: Fe-S cluster assembly protein HesB [Ignavibacteriales bacterium]|nr:Fe-S cluster assembly protein HesB [Ignavibacteriales bacterium]